MVVKGVRRSPVRRIRFSSYILIRINIITNDEIMKSLYFFFELNFSRIINKNWSNKEKSSIELTVLISDMAPDEISQFEIEWTRFYKSNNILFWTRWCWY